MRERQEKRSSGGKWLVLMLLLMMGAGLWLFLGQEQESEAQETPPVQAAVAPETAVGGVKVLVLLLGALGLANMWAAIFADVGVMVLAVLNAVRAMFVNKTTI